MNKMNNAIELLKAAQVIGLTKETRDYLKKNDPKALQQLDNAISNVSPRYKTTLERLRWD